MPNKRDPNKAFVGFFINKNEKKQAMDILQANGSNLSEFFCVKILELLGTKADEIIDKIHANDGRTRAGKQRMRKSK